MLERWTEDDGHGLYKHPEGKWVLYEDAMAGDMNEVPVGPVGLTRTRKVVDRMQIDWSDLVKGIEQVLGKSIEEQVKCEYYNMTTEFHIFWEEEYDRGMSEGCRSGSWFNFKTLAAELRSELRKVTESHFSKYKTVFGEELPNPFLDWNESDPINEDMADCLDNMDRLIHFVYIPVFDAAVTFLGEFADKPIYIIYD